jgi:hypothetical protein
MPIFEILAAVNTTAADLGGVFRDRGGPAGAVADAIYIYYTASKPV